LSGLDFLLQGEEFRVTGIELDGASNLFPSINDFA
jgi:hypothetical protein